MNEFIEKLTKKLYENVKSKGCPDEACWAHLNKNCDSCDSKEIKVQDVIRIVNQLAEEYKDTNVSTIDAGELLGSGWIPCSERLPKESLNSVLGWDEYRNRCCFVQYIGGRWVLGNDIDSVKIIAWQPLPAHYQPKGEING